MPRPSARRRRTFAAAIDAGAQQLGGQNRLARELGTNSGNLANAKAGRAVLTVGQLERLAAIIDVPAEHLWLLMQLARAAHRNPFRKP